jgi:hypothetical protein
MTPEIIWHAMLGLRWEVVRVVEDWTCRSYHDTVGTPGETKRSVVRVRGPLPGNPTEIGEFVMTVRRYGDKPGWWISAEPRA